MKRIESTKHEDLIFGHYTGLNSVRSMFYKNGICDGMYNLSSDYYKSLYKTFIK